MSRKDNIPSSFDTHDEQGLLLCHFCNKRINHKGKDKCSEDMKRVNYTDSCRHGHTHPTRDELRDRILQMDKMLERFDDSNSPKVDWNKAHNEDDEYIQYVGDD